MRVQLCGLLSSFICFGPVLGCDRPDAGGEARSVQCDAAGFRALKADCVCEPGLKLVAGDCVPEDDATTGLDTDAGEDPCRPDGSGCDDTTGASEDPCRRDGSRCDDTGADPEDPPPPPASCGYRTQTQGGWGSACSGQNPGCFRDAHFDAAFPEGLYVGCGVLTANLLSSLAVEQALPTGGQPRALLPAEAVAYDGVDDPKVKTVLFGQVVALSLSVAFDKLAGYDDVDQVLPLADLEIADPASPCTGMFVHEVLTQANYALGGCPSQLSVAAANDCVTAINESFVDGGDHCSAFFAPPPPL